MNIKFVDDNTVLITEELGWTGLRPANKIQIRQSDIVKAFTDKYPDYLVEKAEGTSKIANFRSYEQSKGEWTLTVKNTKTKKRAPKKSPSPVVKKKSPKVVKRNSSKKSLKTKKEA